MAERPAKSFWYVAAVFVIVIGWLTYYLIQNPPGFNSPSSDSVAKGEMAAIEQDLTQYIAEKLKQEKQNSTLQRIVLLPAIKDSEDAMRVPYTLVFDDLVAGEPVTSLVQATAVLNRVQDTWRITKVTTEKETVNYNTAALVKKGGAEEASSSANQTNSP